MNKCPITYDMTDARYSVKGLNLLSRNLNELKDLQLTKEQLLVEAVSRAPKMSIQGVQPKLSATLNVSKNCFEIVDCNGKYILKPPHDTYAEVPQNEDLTMRLASSVGFNIPLHGMVYGRDNELTYFIKRFDRIGRNKKLPVEDFAQISGASRNTKYDSSMEKVVKIINKYCTFPAIERVKLFELTVFNFLIGNEDMHLKNFSMIRNNDKIELSPFYDLLNSTIILKHAREELALPVRGRKNKLTRKDLIKYFGGEVCGINEKILNQVIDRFNGIFNKWQKLIDRSFLSISKKEVYFSLLEKRKRILFS